MSAPGEFVEIRCSACGQYARKRLVWLQANGAVSCVRCGKSNPVRRYKAQAGATALYEKLTGRRAPTRGR